MTYDCSLEVLEFFSAEEQNIQRYVEEQLMNILVIGNGFDLAHGLPTKYGDFLAFCEAIKNINKWKMLGNLAAINKMLVSSYQTLNSGIRLMLPKKFGDVLSDKSNELIDLIDDNCWIEYFLQCEMYQKENWIDFESDISNVIQSIDRDMHDGLSCEFKLEDEAQCISNKFLNERYCDSQITYRKLRDILVSDLNKLIRALELYLCEFVNNLNCKRISPDIEKLSFDKVLSFNYTDTYRKIYDLKELSEYDYIHGKADPLHFLNTNNMVLGIEEYLSKERKNKEVEFIAFKKYYQRIYKETGCKYKEWVDDIRSDMPIRNLKLAYVDEGGSKVYQSENSKYHNLYIFGHSLDITDKDVLRDLILNNNVYTTIFYFNKDDFGTKIANLVKVIGQDELIKRTGGNTKTIEFELQKDMVDR